MNIVYKREMKHNYMMIEPEYNQYEGYELPMLALNQVEGLLKFHINQVNGRNTYYYEITSKQPLSRLLELQSIGFDELKKLIGGIARALENMEGYLLNEQQILLEPDYIYVEPDRFTIFLCLVPGQKQDFAEKMSGLLRYLLGKINHQDKDCVVVAYSLYQESLKQNYGMWNLIEIIEQNRPGGNKGKAPDVRREEPIIETLENSTCSYPVLNHQSLAPQSLSAKEESVPENISGTGRALFVFLAIGLGIELILWLGLGRAGLEKLWYLGGAAGIVGGLLSLMRGRKTPEKSSDLPKARKETMLNREEEFQDWKVMFEETEEKEKESTTIDEEELFQTVLLTEETKDKNLTYLRATGPDCEDIAITYVPFLIGKQEGLADYVLNGENISRIHARIDKTGEEYQISDLNSTNGTYINGRMLNTNETITLKKGDEVSIANFAYIFA